MARIDENPFAKRTRRRVIRTGWFPFGTGIYHTGIFNSPTPFNFTGPELCEAQITESEGHPFWSQLKDQEGLKPDMGGDFKTTRFTPSIDKTIHSSSYNDNFSSHRLWQAAGHIIPNVRDSYQVASNGWGWITPNTDLDALEKDYPALSNSDLELLALGTTAISRTRPDISPSSITQFLVELKRDGLPFLSKLSIKEFKRILNTFEEKGVKKGADKASDYFLENQFGLAPFVSDLKAFSRVAVGGQSTFDNLLKNDGKLIRRRYRFPHETFSSERGHSSSQGFNPFTYQGGQHYTGDWNGLAQVHTERKTWFSGAYRIHMPSDKEPVSRLNEAVNRFRWDYGLELDFATMWNLAPWSWLIDWQTNLGDVITSFSKWSDDTAVLHYGYIMQETVTMYSFVPNGAFITGTKPNRDLPTQGLKVHTKRRIRATPYGFGVSFGSLSTGQKATLAALGITRF
jgi:hypothetical protein